MPSTVQLKTIESIMLLSLSLSLSLSIYLSISLSEVANNLVIYECDLKSLKSKSSAFIHEVHPCDKSSSAWTANGCQAVFECVCGGVALCHEVVSRICREMEYDVCYDIFPLPITRTVGNNSLIESVMGAFQNRGDERMREAETASLDWMKCKISLVDLFWTLVGKTRQSTWHAMQVVSWLYCVHMSTGGTESALACRWQVVCCFLVTF
jgi:hypothetical protein